MWLNCPSSFCGDTYSFGQKHRCQQHVAPKLAETVHATPVCAPHTHCAPTVSDTPPLGLTGDTPLFPRTTSAKDELLSCDGDVYKLFALCQWASSSIWCHSISPPSLYLKWLIAGSPIAVRSLYAAIIPWLQLPLNIGSLGVGPVQHQCPSPHTPHAEDWACSAFGVWLGPLHASSSTQGFLAAGPQWLLSLAAGAL